VGKTTGVLRFLEAQKKKKALYASADGALSQNPSWLEEQWFLQKSQSPSGLLVIDEIQKVENWSETIKKLWDRQKRMPERLRVILLGSSSLEIQKGLSESLAGRFHLQKVHHWNLQESREAYGLTLEQFLCFGGYPGSYALARDRIQWLHYLKDSIVDAVIGRDILQLSRVKSPALFRQCFDLACAYGGQEISYTKLLGQLQDKGNVELVKHYLELFEGAFLLKQLPKFSQKKVLARASSPKILPLCPALYSLTKDADLDKESRGRAFEIAIGCELNRLPGTLSYWRERNDEVDYIYNFGRRIYAIEVKSGRKKNARGLGRFLEQFPAAEGLIVTPENFHAVLEKVKTPSEK
jgi:predicted AAA+ superfamily ATPase